MFSQQNTLRDRWIAVLVLISALLLVPFIGFAAEFRTGEQPSFGNNEIAEDLYIAGGNVTSSGDITGDFVGGGGNVLVNSNVSSDLHVAGGSVTVLGNVGDDVRAAGGQVLVNGSVGDDVIAVGGSIQISGDGVGGDVVTAGGSILIDAPVQGSLKAAGGEVRVNASVNGNVHIEAEKITFGDNVVVNGNFTYSSSEEMEFSEGQILGTVEFTQVDRGVPSKGAVAKGVFAFLSLWLLARILMSFVAGIALMYAFRRFASELVKHAYGRPFVQLLRGFLTLVAVPIASVILLATVVGIPLGLLGLVGYIGIIIFGSIVAPLILGSLLYKLIARKDGYTVTLSSVLLGAVVYHLVALVPFIGWIATFAFFLIAIGTMVYMKWELLKEWR